MGIASRWTLRIASVALVLVAAGAVSAGPATKVPDEPYPADFRARLRKSITQAIEYLRTKQIDDSEPEPTPDPGRKSRLDPKIEKRMDEETRFEESAAVLWALRRAGVPGDDKTVVKAMKIVGARAPRTPEEAALLLMGLCAPALQGGDPFTIADGAAAGEAPHKLTAEERPLVERAVKFLLGEQIKSSMLGEEEIGGWDPCLPGVDRDDMKTRFVADTYLALIGLEAAARVGVAVPAATFQAALKFLLGRQAPKGSAVTLKMNEVRGRERAEWTESAQARGFSSVGLEGQAEGHSTAAGAVAIAVCQDALQKDKSFAPLRQKTRLALRDALAWIQAKYDIRKNPVVGGKASDRVDEGTLYYEHWLQALARLEIHARMRLIGGHDWYAEGAEALLKTQHEDGSWEPIWWSNCYSALFLMRASLTSIAPVVTEPR